MSVPPVRRRKARPLDLAGASEKLRGVQARIVDLERQLEAEKVGAHSYQRLVWRLEQELGAEVTRDEIEADPLFHIRFPDHKTV